MSGLRSIATPGIGVVGADLQRGLDSGAAGDDRAFALLATPGALHKRVIPFFEESLATRLMLLVVPSGTTSGALDVRPCSLLVASDTPGLVVDFEARLDAAATSALIPDNSSGSTRYYLLYATIARSTDGFTASRPAKDLASGNISTQSVAVADQPKVTLGTAVASSKGGAYAALPADSGSAWNIPLAVLQVTNGYTSGTAHLQSAITPCWPGGGVPQARVVPPVAAIFRGTDGHCPATQSFLYPMADGRTQYLGGVRDMYAGIVYLPADGSNGVWTLLDDSIDWRRRFLWATAVRIVPVAGAVVEPNSSSSMGSKGSKSVDFGRAFAGDGTDNATTPGADSTMNTLQATFSAVGAAGCNIGISLLVKTNGKLYVGVFASSSGGPLDTTNGDNFSLFLNASPQFR